MSEVTDEIIEGDVDDSSLLSAPEKTEPDHTCSTGDEGAAVEPGVDEDLKTNPVLVDSSSGIMYVTTIFKEGPLGVNLQRRPVDGIVAVIDFVDNSQAVALDISIGDELWKVGEKEVGGTYLDKQGWQALVEYIKTSVRPLEITWRRFPPGFERTEIESDAQQQSVRSNSADSAEVQDAGAENVAKLHVSHSTGEMLKRDEHSASYRMLEAVLATLVKKPSTNGGKEAPHSFPYKYLLQEDRRLIRRGDLATPGATTLWMKSTVKKHIILLSDVLIVTVPVQANQKQQHQQALQYQVEHLIDLQACKLRSNGQVFGGGLADAKGPSGPSSSSSSLAEADAQRTSSEASFEIIWPGGSMQLISDSKETKEVWVLNLFLAICARVGGESNGKGQVLGWRHQYMLGTMHSAVLNHDEEHVRMLINQCDRGEMEFSACMDAEDEDGYTPLHYACIMRVPGIINALHEAAADVTAQDHRGLTPLHWAAMQLDEYTLSLLCSHVFDVDLYDKFYRTPLYMACVEGRNMAGHTDTEALKKCVACLLSHQPNVHNYDGNGFTLVHYLAASWQYEAMDLLLQQADADPNARAVHGGAMPLHLACAAAPIKPADGEGLKIIRGEELKDPWRSGGGGGAKKDTTAAGAGAAPGEAIGAGEQFEKLARPFGSVTLRALLKSGARPNAKDHAGRSPLMILAQPGKDDDWDLMELTDAVAMLVSFGARFDDSALLAGLKSRLLGVSIDALAERWASLPVINGDSLNIG
jgi:ankyrin repeat protein